MQVDPSVAPDGIEQRHAGGGGWSQRHASPIPLIAIAILLAVACLGLLGGKPHPVQIRADDHVRLTVDSPTVLRNGMFFETRIMIEPLRPMKEVVLGISPALWRDITINSAIPAAEKEEFGDGMIRLSFGPGEAGKPLVIKFDGQINPPLVGQSRGEIAVFDGDRQLAALPIRLRILP